MIVVKVKNYYRSFIVTTDLFCLKGFVSNGQNKLAFVTFSKLYHKLFLSGYLKYKTIIYQILFINEMLPHLKQNKTKNKK